jgi:hypothetical protein
VPVHPRHRDDVGIGTVVIGKWNGVLELLIITIVDRTRFYPPCVRFEALNDIIDLSVVRSCNRQQVGFHHDVELDHGRPSCGRRGKLVGCIESVCELEFV